jgi:hypothetical protein
LICFPIWIYLHDQQKQYNVAKSNRIVFPTLADIWLTKTILIWLIQNGTKNNTNTNIIESGRNGNVIELERSGNIIESE